jgi:outer membrane immunogenic protein
MRKLVFAIIGAIALAATSRPAAAADIPVYGYGARQSIVIFTWTGFYLGAHAGGGWGTKNIDAQPFQVNSTLFSPPGTTPNVNGWLGGGQIGVNYQAGSWVVGVELDASAADLNGSANCTPAALVTVVGNCSAKVDMVGTVAGRLGVAFDRLLVYGKGGAAWANDQYQLNSALLAFNASETRWGWMVGAGVEYSFTDTWSAKIEYNYLDLRTRAIRFTDTTGFFNLDTNIGERIHVVKAGINYRFGWAPVGVTY